MCRDVKIEPIHQPLQARSFDSSSSTREETVRLDIEAKSLWVHQCTRCFFEKKIFNLLGKTSKISSDPCKCQENFKKTKRQAIYSGYRVEQPRSIDLPKQWWRCAHSKKSPASTRKEDTGKRSESRPTLWSTSKRKTPLLSSKATYIVWGDADQWNQASH